MRTISPSRNVRTVVSGGASFLRRKFGLPSILLLKLVLAISFAAGVYGSLKHGLAVSKAGLRLGPCISREGDGYFECAVWQDLRSLASFGFGVLLCSFNRCFSSPGEGRAVPPAGVPGGGALGSQSPALAEKLQLYSYAL